MNHTPKTIKAIQVAITIAKAAQQERLLGMATGSHAFRFHPVNNPAVHWSGVSQRTLSILRGNREAVGNNGGVVMGAAIFRMTDITIPATLLRSALLLSTMGLA